MKINTIEKIIQMYKDNSCLDDISKETGYPTEQCEIACKNENPNYNFDSDDFDYGCSCYKSALKHTSHYWKMNIAAHLNVFLRNL